MDNNTFTKEIYEKNINNQPITYVQFIYLANQLLKSYELIDDICQYNSSSTLDLNSSSDKEIRIDTKNSTPDLKLKSTSTLDREMGINSENSTLDSENSTFDSENSTLDSENSTPDSENSTLDSEPTSYSSYSTEYQITNNICNSIKLGSNNKLSSSTNTLSYPSEFTKKNLFMNSNDLSDTLETIKSIDFIELSDSIQDVKLNDILDLKNKNQSNSIIDDNLNKIQYGKINIRVNPKIKFNLDIDINNDINISIM